MNRSIIKIICLITVFSMTVAFAIGALAMKQSREYLTAEIEEKILNTAENFSNDFSAGFNHMEGLTDSLASHVITSFDVDDFKADPARYMDGYKEDLSDFIETNMHTTDNAHSLYVTFNPELTSRNDEVWFAVIDGKVQEIKADFQENQRDFEYPYADDMVYFFEPQNKDSGVWTGPYYDKDIDEEVFSYSRAIYIDDIFVGVAGADINADDTINIVKEMKLYPSGFSALLDEEGRFVVQPDDVASDEEKVIWEEVGKVTDADIDAGSGSIHYAFGGEAKLMGFSMMDNGWTMVIVQPKKEAYEPIDKLTTVFFILAFIMAVVLVAFLFAFSIPFIRRQSFLEAENKEKEILLIYQSRQAKIGEMLGNVTHQWKQPLNTIKLIMANLLDSYRYDDLDEERLQKSVAKVDGIIDRMSETIGDFSDFLKPTKDKEVFDVRECIRAALSLMEESLTYHRIHVEISCDTDRKAYGYFNETVHVVFNILNNARDAIVSADPDERRIDINVCSEGEMVKIDVTNRGDSIPDDVLSKLFEPYFTTKESTGGTGLGLYMSKQITEDRMGGRLYIENVESGVICRVLIPAGGENEMTEGGAADMKEEEHDEEKE